MQQKIALLIEACDIGGVACDNAILETDGYQELYA